ncbi:hypothetical protein Tco_1116838 [Tanacetum coccineum]
MVDGCFSHCDSCSISYLGFKYRNEGDADQIAKFGIMAFIICSALTIINSKHILELKYQAGHETALKDLELQQPGRLPVEKLKRHVKNHWIMAGTGSPQFIIAFSATTSASGCFKAMFSASSIVMGQKPEQQENFHDLRRYVLQLQDNMELSERTLKSISKSVNRLIVKAEKQQPNNLMKLLEVSKGFEGVGKYDSLHAPPLSAQQYIDCVHRPVSEGLKYVTLVEESLNATNDYNHAPEVNTAGLILHWFKNTAKDMVTEVQSMDIGSVNDNSNYRSICANSMYRITESILLSYHTNIDELSQEDLFMELSSMISDILAACLTNLPQVIVTKCHECVIEKRESSVNATVQLLGETTQIMNTLQHQELPELDPAELPFIDKWRDYFNYPSP